MTHERSDAKTVTQRNIIFVQPHLEFGGAENQTVLLANKFASSGVPTTVVLFEARGGLLRSLDRSVRVVDIGLENHLLLPLVAFRLWRVLRGLPNATVIVKLWSAILACGLIQRFCTNHRFVFTEDLDPSDHADFITLGRLKQALVARVFRRQSLLIANSELVSEQMKIAYNIETEPIVIHPVVDLEAFRDTRLAPAPDLEGATRPDIYLISTGSLIERKGLHVTHKALEVSGLRAHWTIIGEGDLRHEIETWNSDLLSIELVGGTPTPVNHYHSQAIFVHSALSEAFGIVLIEALAAGLPVIASNTLGAKLIHSATGSGAGHMQLFPIGDETALAEALKAAASSTVIETGARERIKASVAPFAVEAAVSRWSDVFELRMRNKESEWHA